MAWKKFDPTAPPEPTAAPMATLSADGMIYLNAAAVALIPKAQHVEFYFEDQRRLVGIKPADEGDTTSRLVALPGKSFRKLSAGRFLKAVGVTVTETARFAVSRNRSTGMLVIEMRKPLPQSTRGRRRADTDDGGSGSEPEAGAAAEQ